mmetsp:Transcript_115989/g.247932  ORF Transcript_115989/g.247932 Transcript_115989/m.247932 type:complete len:239 (-) Transcript_115989:1325-2041(-)
MSIEAACWASSTLKFRGIRPSSRTASSSPGWVRSTPRMRSASKPRRLRCDTILCQRPTSAGRFRTYTARLSKTHFFALSDSAAVVWRDRPRTGRSHNEAFSNGWNGHLCGSGALPICERRSCASHQVQWPFVQRQPSNFIQAQHQLRPLKSAAPLGRFPKFAHLVRQLSDKANVLAYGLLCGNGADLLQKPASPLECGAETSPNVITPTELRSAARKPRSRLPGPEYKRARTTFAGIP